MGHGDLQTFVSKYLTTSVELQGWEVDRLLIFQVGKELAHV